MRRKSGCIAYEQQLARSAVFCPHECASHASITILYNCNCEFASRVAGNDRHLRCCFAARCARALRAVADNGRERARVRVERAAKSDDARGQTSAPSVRSIVSERASERASGDQTHAAAVCCNAIVVGDDEFRGGARRPKLEPRFGDVNMRVGSCCRAEGVKLGDRSRKQTTIEIRECEQTEKNQADRAIASRHQAAAAKNLDRSGHPARNQATLSPSNAALCPRKHRQHAARRSSLTSTGLLTTLGAL